MDPFPPLVAASTEQTVPSVSSFPLPDTLTAVLLASPGACATRCFRVWSHRPCRPETPPPRRLPLLIPPAPCTVLRIRSGATRVARCAQGSTERDSVSSGFRQGGFRQGGECSNGYAESVVKSDGGRFQLCQFLLVATTRSHCARASRPRWAAAYTDWGRPPNAGAR